MTAEERILNYDRKFNAHSLIKEQLLMLPTSLVVYAAKGGEGKKKQCGAKYNG